MLSLIYDRQQNLRPLMNAPSRNEFTAIINSALRFSLATIQKNASLFLALALLSGILIGAITMIMLLLAGFLSGLLGVSLDFDGAATYILVGSIITALIVVSAGLKHTALNLYDQKITTVRDFFHGFRHVGVYLITSLLYYVLVGVGVGVAALLAFAITQLVPDVNPHFLYLIPIIIGPPFTIPFRFAGVIALDRGVGAGTALRQSLALTKGLRIKLFVLYASLLLIINAPVSAVVRNIPDTVVITSALSYLIASVFVIGIVLFTLHLLPEIYIYRALWYRKSLSEPPSY